MTTSNLPWIVVSLGVLAVVLAGRGQAAEPPIPTINDAGILANAPGGTLKMPPRLFTPEMTDLLRDKSVFADYFAVRMGRPDRAAQWLKVPEDLWREMIEPYVPLCNSGRAGTMGHCPFCGALAASPPTMTVAQFLDNPWVAYQPCCGAKVYAREADMPADYKARPNRTETIPALDGGTTDYHFYCPPGTENAPIAYAGPRKEWFSSECEAYRPRLAIISDQVIPDLTAAVFWRNDSQAAHLLAVLLDRIADVYPALQPYSASEGNCLALNRAGNGYLTREEYLSEPGPHIYTRVFWYRGGGNGYDKLGPDPGGWGDAVMAAGGNLAEAFDLIRDRAEVKAYSQERYDQPEAWEQRVYERVMEECAFLNKAGSPTNGNTMINWCFGAVRLGTVVQDDFFLRHALDFQEKQFPNGYFADGMSEQGAFNYGGMMFPFVQSAWMLERFAGVKADDRYPFLKLVRRNSDNDWSKFPVRTLLGVESQHSDEHNWFFAGLGWGWQVPPDKVDYAAHAQALNFPEYGLGCLRAGDPGSRLEAILDYQNVGAHAHQAKLNLQLFYEGISLLPDIGYCAGNNVDPTREPWKSFRYPYPLMSSPNPSDPWGGWYFHYNTLGEPHCTALVEGQPHNQTPVAFQRFLSGGDPGSGTWRTQLLEVDGRGAFAAPEGGMDRFNRQVVVLTLPSGRSVLVDFFRLRGGKRHDLYWHVPAPDPQTSLGAPAPVAQPNLETYLKANGAPGATEAARYIDTLRKVDLPAETWDATWTIRPHDYDPVTEGGKKRQKPWSDVLHDVTLRMWGAAQGGPAGEQSVLQARGPWPSNIAEVGPDGKEVRGQVGFKGGFSFFIETRRADDPGLESSFVHVLEPRNPEQTPALESAEILPASGTGAGARLRTVEGQEVLMASTLGEAPYRTAQISLTGRLGVVAPLARQVTLYDGSQLEAGGWAVELEPSWRMKLLGAIGDLSGQPGEAALIVASERPLPTDGTLVGQALTVHHQIDDQHTSGYTIAKVSTFGAGRWRIDLQDQPPFIQNQLSLRQLDPARPRVITSDFWMSKGGPGIYTGRRVRLPRLGFDSPIVKPIMKTAWHCDSAELASDLPAEAKVGDLMIIYSLQPGDEVVIPSYFSLTSAEPGRLQVVTTGPARLTLPPGLKVKGVLGADGALKPVASESVRGREQVTLTAKDTPEGRARLVVEG